MSESVIDRLKAERKHPNIQDLMLDLIQQGSFNAFEGPRVHNDLAEHNELWLAASMYPSCPGLLIRDIPDGSFHCDTLYILTDKKRWKKLRPIINTWRADAITKIDRKGTKVADRYATEDDSYKFEKHGQQDVGSFLGSWPADKKGKDDDRVVIRLWWD